MNVSQFLVDPGNTCGDGPGSATAGYRIETSVDGTTFTTAADGTFTQGQAHTLVPVTPAAGTDSGVAYVRFWMLNPMVFQLGGTCPGPSSGCNYLDMSEFEVIGAIAVTRLDSC